MEFLQNSVRWEYPEYVQLLVQEENDYTMSVFNDAGKNLVVEAKKD
jgi:hypothetical protein